MGDADMEVDQNRLQLEVQQDYVSFLDDGHQDGTYNKKINDMIKESKKRLILNINDLRRKNPVRCAALLDNGAEEMPLLQKALREVVSTINQDYFKEHDDFFVGLEGSFGAKHVTPRTLNSRFIGSVVCLEGIVTKCSTIHPKIVRSVHYCPATKKTIERKFTDLTTSDALPSTIINIYPTKDDNGNLLETEYGRSKYRDHQTITLQEMPERAPTGQLPRALDIMLDDDLVDMVKPGDRILVIGTYRCLPGKHGGYTSGVFRCTIVANNIILMTKDAHLTISANDITECKKFAKTANPFNTLARSLAPSIHGHEYIKKAVLALLLGGVEKILPNATRLRGDINILLIGDPSVAKSQILRYVANVAPRVVLTTGRGSSGVGLTAAVTTDNETGERRLEAGAMVLADRGIVCIDEFDKMSDIDRTSIHEVMEQGRVTISKAGIHARLNSRTSVLAAANPVYGRYDEYKSPMENIGLQDSLLSRFDLVFIILDTSEPNLDNAIAEHVLRMHRYRNPGEQDGEATPLFMLDQNLTTLSIEEEQQQHNQQQQKKGTQVYEKHDPLLHGRSTRGNKILSMEFMKKYIHIAKCLKPVLSSEAALVISEEYTRLRSLNVAEQHIARTTPITARSLETLIRLSTAFARGRMSGTITKDDALAAIELVQFAYFKKVLEKKKKKRQRNENGDEDGGSDVEGEGEEEEDDDDEHGEDGESNPKRVRRTEEGTNGNGAHEPEENPPDKNGTTNGHEAMDIDLDRHETSVLSAAGDDEQPSTSTQATSISTERYEKFKVALSNVFSYERLQSMPRNTVVEALTTTHGFNIGEALAGLNRMIGDENIMEAEGFLFLF